MREARLTFILLLIAAVLGLFGISTLGAGSFVSSDDFALRLSANVYGFPISTGDLKLEGALSLCDVSVSAWGELQAPPLLISGFGGGLSLTKDWLSLRLSATQNAYDKVLLLVSDAAPPALLLVEGDITLLLGGTASASTNICGAPLDSRISLAPYLAGVLSPGGLLIKPSIGLDLDMGPQSLCPSISGARVSSTVDLGNVSISSTVSFAGAFEDFSSLVLLVCVPECGLTVSASVVPTELGDGCLYQLGFSYEWGNGTLLPMFKGTPSTICTDGVCY